MQGFIFKSLLSLALFFSFAPLASAALVNINTASLTELKTLPGIGDVKAQAIIDYRTQNGLFTTITDIMNVSGIGQATLNNISSLITVGDSSTPTPPSPSPAPPSTADTTSDPSGSVQSSSKSIWLVSGKSEQYEVGIEGERASVVGAPVQFKAETNFGFIKNSIFKWNLGDGNIKYGQMITHTYSYPGEYVVVLDVELPNDDIHLRTSIKILGVEPAISYASPERVEVFNNSSAELSLYGRVLVVSGKTFAFPEGTILLPGQKISFTSQITGLSPANTQATYLLAVGDNPNYSNNGVSRVEEMRMKSIADIKGKISDLESKLALARANYRSASSVAKAQATQAPEASEAKEADEATPDPEALTASALSSVDSVEQSGLFSKLKKFFLRTR